MNQTVSVCIPIYNGEEYLKECLESVLSQSYRDLEILLVDDGSTDNSIQIIKEFQKEDSRIKLFINDTNLGLVKNWQKCIEKSSGKWIKFLFQDDLMHHLCVERMLKACLDNNVLISICSREFIIEESASISLKNFYTRQVLLLETDFPNPTLLESKEVARLAKQRLFNNFIGEPIVLLFDKKIIDKVGNYNSDLVQLVDYEFILRVCLNFKSYFVPEKLVYYRVHSTSESSRNKSDLGIRMTKNEFIEPLILFHEYLFNKSLIKIRNNLGFIYLFKKALKFYIDNHKRYTLSSDLEYELYNKYRGLMVIKATNDLLRFRANFKGLFKFL